MRVAPWLSFLGLMGALACGSGGGTGSTPTPPPVIQSFQATPATIPAGGTSTLAWSVSGATSLRLEPGGLDVSHATSRSVSPSQTTTYTLTATGAGGSASLSTLLTVQPSSGPITLAYAALPGVDPNLLSLDIHPTVPGSPKPVLVYVHGGGWSAGDKAHVDAKSAASAAQGYLFVSLNYRLTTDSLTFPAQPQDLAKALRWIRSNIAAYGGDPARIHLMGHSAGCHLVSLLATDGSYLAAEGMTLADLKGVIALDTQAYDLPALAQLQGGTLGGLYAYTFGASPVGWVTASPITHVASGKGIPPFFVAFSGGSAAGEDAERKTLSTAFYQKLQQSHVLAELEPAPELTHAQINQGFGAPGDPVARAAFAFLNRLQIPPGAAYLSDRFANIAVTSNLPYGQSPSWDGPVQTHLLDLYQPQGDASLRRPAIVWIHGGGFTGGSKNVAQMVSLAQRFAAKGYVCASISYRLRPQAQVDADLNSAIRDAGEDAKAAVRWLRRHADLYRIDPDRIAIGGGSAGAFTALWAAYADGEGNSGNPGFSSKVGAVVDFWGGLMELGQMGAGEAPVMIIHGTEDPTVPYALGDALRQRARDMGVGYVFHPLIGAGHGAWGYLDDAERWIAPFLYRALRIGETL